MRRLLPLVLLAGCAHQPPDAPRPPNNRGLAVESAALRPLAAPGAIAARKATQVIHAAHGARAIMLRTVIQVDAARLTVAGVTATGQRVFTVSWDGANVAADQSPFVPNNIAPERMLADLQLALFPLDVMAPLLRSAGFDVSEPIAGLRRLRRGDALIAEVHYASGDAWDGRLWFVSFEHGYSLTIDTTSASL